MDYKNIKLGLTDVIKLSVFLVTFTFGGAKLYFLLHDNFKQSARERAELKKEIAEVKDALASQGALGKNDKKAIYKELASLHKTDDSHTYELREFKQKASEEHRVFTDRYFNLSMTIAEWIGRNNKKRRR